MFRIEGFARFQGRVRAAPHPPHQVGQLAADDLGAERLVVQAEPGQKVRIEKVPERTVAHVVQQGGEAHERLDVAARGQVGAHRLQTVVQSARRSARQVHGAEHVLEPRVLGRREDPPRGLELVDLAEPLEPRVIDDVPLRHLAFGKPLGRGERDVSVKRVVAEALVAKLTHGNRIILSAGENGTGPTSGSAVSRRILRQFRSRVGGSGCLSSRVHPRATHPCNLESGRGQQVHRPWMLACFDADRPAGG